MKVITKVLIFFSVAIVFTTTVWAEKFHTLEDADKLVQRLMLTGGDYLRDKDRKLIDRSDDLNNLINDLDTAIETDESNPVYWLLRGLARRNLLKSYRAGKWSKFTREQYFNNPELQSILKTSEQDYQKAIELDKQPGAPMHLTYEMLTAVVGRDALLSAKTTELYTKRLFESYPSNNRQIVENNYGAMYAAYIKEGRFDDAVRIIDDMEKALARFYTTEQLNDFILKYRVAVENVKLEAIAVNQKKIQEDIDKPSPAPKIAVEDTEDTQQPIQADTKETPLHSPVKQPPGFDLQQLLLIIIGIVILGTVVFYLLSKKKR